jgi:hypothetical protein
MSTYLYVQHYKWVVGQSFGLHRIGWLVSMANFEWYGFKGTYHIPGPRPPPPQFFPNVPNHMHPTWRFIEFLFPMVFRILFIMKSIIISWENNIQMSTMLLKTTSWCKKKKWSKNLFLCSLFCIVLMSFSCGETSQFCNVANIGNPPQRGISPIWLQERKVGILM